VAGVPCIVSTTGYTGEDGVEIYLPAARAEKVWDALLEAGAEDGLIPCGLGARDTLRMEAGMPLYGHELSDTITPLEAGLTAFVKLEKPEFIGREALLAHAVPERRRVGLKVVSRGIVREHQEVYLDGQPVGMTTSGTHCPYLGGAYAMALVRADIPAQGARVEVDVRGRRVEAETVQLPFYRRNK
jgi:aminomethyltransferase